MHTGLTISVGLHAAVFAIAWFGLPQLRDDEILPEQLVIVDMVDISEVTNTPTAMVEPEKAEEPKPQPPQPEPEPQEAPPPPPKAEAPPPPPAPAPAPEPAPQPAPEPEPVAEKIPEPAPEPAPKPEPEPEPEPVAEAPAPAPVPVTKPRAPEPEKAPEKKQAETPKKEDKRQDFSRLLKTLEKTEPQEAPTPAPEQPKKKETADPLKDVLAKLKSPARSRSDKAFDPESKVTISEIDAVRRQISRCWNVPAGAKDAENLVIEIALQMRSDGTVLDARIVDQSRLARDDFFRSAAESARRAVLSCGKLPLPSEKYESWKNITMTFNPRDLL